MASTDSRPVPQKNVAYRVIFPIFDADGDLVTGAAGLDSEVSKDCGTFADCTNEATEIATSSGMYYLDLTSTEMNADSVAVIVKTSTSGAKTTPIVLYPEEAGDIRVNVTAYGGTAGTFSSGRPEVNTTHVAGTSQTGRDIGASVLLSSGTGPGQLDFTSGVVKGNVTQFGGSNGTFASGRPEVNTTHFAGTAATASAGIPEVKVNNIAASAITATAIASDAITAAKIADGAIDRATFAADTGLQSIRSNTAQAGAAGTVTLDASASSTTDYYAGQVIALTGGTGVGQSRLCTAYNGTTKVATITPNWATNPDNTSTFAVLNIGSVNLAAIGAAALSTSTAQLGVNVVNFGGSAGTFASGRPEVNTTHVGGTSQTAKDLGAINVTNLNTLSSHDPGATLGTSTLTQTQVTGGAYALNSASFAFNSGLDLTTTQKASVNTEADTALSDYGALKPTTAGRTLDVTTTGEAGIDWANIGSPTTTVNLSGTTVKTATDVETDTQDIQSRLPAALTGGGNIKADVIALSGDTTAADNAEAFFDGTGYAGTNNVIPLVTTTTNLTNKGDGSGFTALPWNASWDAEVQSEVQDAIEVNNLDHLVKVAVDTDFATTVHLNSVIGQIADNGTTATFDRTTDSLEALQGVSAPTAAAIADAVWEEDLTDHSGTVGSVAEALGAAGSAGDPWSTALPGAYGSGTAGKIIGDNINATISSRASQTSLDTLDDYVDTEVAAIKAKTDNLPASPANESTLTTIAGYIDTEVAAIKAKTDNLPASPAATSDCITAAGVRSAVGLASANLDTQLTTIDDFLDTEVAAIKAKTDNLPASPANEATLTTIAGYIDTEVAAIKAKTDQLTFTNANKVDSTAITVSDKTGYSLSSAGVQAIWDALTSALTTVGSVGKWIVDKLDVVVSTRASQTSLDTLDDYVDTEVAAIKAKTDNLPASPANEATLTTIAGYIDTEVAAIKAKTDNLPSDPADASDIAASFSTVNSTLSTIAGYIDTEVAAIKAKTDNLPSDPADASDIAASFSTVNTKLDTIDDFLDTEVAAIKAKTDSLTFTVAGQVDANVNYVNEVQITGTGESGDEWGPL